MKQHPLKIVKKTLANDMFKNLNNKKVKSCEMKCEFQNWRRYKGHFEK
jgi:hypothetical protein